MKKALVRGVRAVLKDPEIRHGIWHAANRPDLERMGPVPPRDPWHQAWENAAQTSAEYVEQHMLTAPVFEHRRALLDLCLERVCLEGNYLEFGCGHEGNSINYLADRIDTTIHGFDSFEGLPEAWFGELNEGSLSTGGWLPTVRDNVVLHQGWFNETAPVFAASHREPVAFLHVDCDLYSSTKTIFEALGDQIVTGTVIQFDEYFNYPGWQVHEYKAFQEFVEERELTYEYLGFTRRFAVAVQIT